MTVSPKCENFKNLHLVSAALLDVLEHSDDIIAFGPCVRLRFLF